MTGISTTVVGGGRGYTTDNTLGTDGDVLGEPRPGLSVQVWDWEEARWASAGNSPDLDLDATTPLVVSGDASWITPATGKVHMRLQTSNLYGNGAEPPALALDYVELEVTYRRP